MSGYTTIFNNRAEDYSKARPGYSEKVLDLLCGELLKSGDIIADVGSGTGIFSKALLERGFAVFGVEPNDEMRKQAEKMLCENKLFTSVAASAENTTLQSNSIDVVTAASAFHWFDAERFHLECLRILKQDGFLFVVYNVRDYQDAFTLEQHKLCLRFCPGFSSLKHGLEKSIPKLEAMLGSNLHTVQYDYPLTYSKENFIRRSLSSSYAPEKGTVEYDAYVNGLKMLLQEYAPDRDEITVPNLSVVYWGRPIG